jgi:hypothetical protein
MHAGAVRTLYVEELRAAMRGRFAWLGAAVILLAVGGLATVGTQDTWLDGYGIIAYVLVPLAFIPFAAGMVASPRVNRFVESVFTAPVERGSWFAAKVLVLFTLAAGYYAALVPMMLVYAHHVGVPPLLRSFLIASPVILISSIAIGTLVGVLFIGRSLAPPAATGMGLVLAYAGLVPLQELMVGQGNGATHTGRVTLISSAVLIKNAFGFALAVGSIPSTTTWTWISLGVLVLGSVALAAWIFLRAQGVETWEASRPQRWTIGIAIAVIFLFPTLFADRNYDTAAPRQNRAPVIRALFARANSTLAMAPPGGQLPRRCCGTILNRDQWPIGTDERTREDLFVLLPVDANVRVSGLKIDVAGDAGLHVVADPAALDAAGSHLETHTYMTDMGPTASDGHRVETGWVARVPVTLDPANPWDIGGDRYPISVTATYHVDGDPQTRVLMSRAAIDAQVASGIYEMGVASLVLPLVCFGAALVRWRRTR